MNIEIDYNPSPKTSFFISVGLNDTEAISFDNTTKGHRIIKQVLIEKRLMAKNQKLSGEWDVIILDDRKFVKKYHVKWVDKDKIDIINDEVWETVWEKPMSNEDRDKLIHYSQLISDNYLNLKEFEKDLKDFEMIVSQIVREVQ